MTEQQEQFNWKEFDRRSNSSELAVLGQRMSAMEAHLASVQADLKTLDQRADTSELHQAKIETSVATIAKFVKWSFGVLIGSGVVTTGSAFHLFDEKPPINPTPVVPEVRQLPPNEARP